MIKTNAGKGVRRSGMNIAILGGSFDPPHKGHVAIANKLIRLFHFNSVWLMPCYQHPFNKNLSDPNKRLEMTKYLEKGPTKVSDLEIRKKTISYTIDTLRELAKKHPQDKFSWIIGTDQVDSFTKWKEWKKIINNFKLIIVPRTGFKKAEIKLQEISKQVLFPKNIISIDQKKFPPIYVSSKLTRERIKRNKSSTDSVLDKSISNMVPKRVKDYIIENKLYS